MSQFDRTSEQALAEARRILSIDEVIRRLEGRTIGKLDTCPFCETKKKFGLFTKGPRRLYKCFSPSCSAHIAGDEISFIALRLNMDRKSAFKEFLNMAGVS